MSFTLPPLHYTFNALEPFIDADTMEIHYSKHHQTYVDNANKAIEGRDELKGLCPEQVLAKLRHLPTAYQGAIRNNVGGHANHSLFWNCMKIGTELKGELKDAIIRDFGSVDGLRESLTNSAIGRFGSGWSWLILSKEGKLFIASTANQDSPIMGKEIAGVEGYPLLNLDVWEHAYYLKYQNRRLEYVNAFWHIINWDYVASRFAKARDQNFDL